MTPVYTRVESVRTRLAGKVQFQSDPATVAPGELPSELLLQLINDAETSVEQDLRGRYMVPFQSVKYGNFENLPDHSKRAIRMAVDLKAVMMVLATDFGRSGAVDAEKYYDNLLKTYENHIDLLLGLSREQAHEKQEVVRFRRTPPLDDLRLAIGNTEADDGYRGMVINTDMKERDASSYASQQVNDPSRAFISTRRGGVVR